MNKITKCLNIWNLKGLSTLGRVLIVKSMAISTLIYQLSMLPTPSLNFMNRVKDKMYKFIWNNKRDKIKRTIMNQEYKLGGCKMIDINVKNKSLKLAWIPRIFCNFNCFWVECIKSNLHFPMEHILAGNLNKKDIATCLGHCTSTFWYEMFQYWAELNFTNTVSTFEDVANQPVWLNSNIKCHKKLLYSDSLISKKLVYVSDILNSDLKLLTLDQFNEKFALQWNEINFDKIILALPLE